MKNLIKISALALVGLTSLVACGGSGKTAKLSFTDGEAHAAAVLPVHTVDSEYAWNMMQMTSVDVKVTLNKDNYVYFVEDWGVKEKDNAMFFHRTWEYKGSLSVENDVYKLAKASHVKKFVEYGSSFAEYESVWGKQGTIEDAEADLAKFTEATATFGSDGNITFKLVVTVTVG